MTSLRKKIKEILGDELQVASLATMEEGCRPWVRYVTIRGSEDFTIRFATFIRSRKVGHILKNPEVHITCGVIQPHPSSHFLQIQAVARISDDPGEKARFWHEGLEPYFQGPEDPDYVVVICEPYRIEVMDYGTRKTEVWATP